LQERLDRQGPLELKEILRIGMQVAAGLSAAHAQGVVHRDIKPANILLEHGVERVKITDFGLARTIDDASLTASGVIAGTPQYMAPEQARGEAVDHRCDLFSLGSVLYATCTGHSPFRAETFMAAWRRLCMDSPRPIREANPEVPEWLAEIIEKLHAKQPRDRFQTAEEVSDLLARHLAHLQQPTVAPRPARLRSARFTLFRRTRGPVCLAAAVLLVGLATVAGWRRLAADRGSQSDVAAERADDASGSRAAAPGEAGDVGSHARPEAPRVEWADELAEAEIELQRVESQLRQPASTFPSAEREGLLDIESALQKLERELDVGR
jgi:hypothetical protein